MPRRRRGIPVTHFKLFGVLIFALLVRNTAARLASGLAGSLALAAAALFRALAEIAGVDRFDMRHGTILHNSILNLILTERAPFVNRSPRIRSKKSHPARDRLSRLTNVLSFYIMSG
jgi:hypothetical protein